ncbi:GGDEF domain-containing protein [Rhizobium sp. CG5]|uniref:GGDEF domain-containing protein n=1 Tax=Rhizobium sp. CG5 TaxID=2726076 RepID=UPI0020341FD7|nr:GGDEF domain-containing protein [Rhizobium sp. CG5]MCM2473212.1 GGDEF domain-containing protein [Rhizobium sp. CG5]
MHLFKNWILLQVDLGSFTRKGAVYEFALKMALRAILLSFILNLIVLPICHSLGLVPMALGDAIRLSVVMSWLVVGGTSGALGILTGHMIRHLSLSKAEFEHLSRTDMLSGLHNRRAFSDFLDKTVGPASLAILDLDRFKSINDGYGHCAGDAVIQGVSGILREVFGERHVTARLGGEEFGVIIHGGTPESRLAMVEEVRAAIAGRIMTLDGAVISTTISAGVAEIRSGRRIEAIYSSADRALYLAKAGGRNRVVHEDDGVALFETPLKEAAGGF